jgi:hypothetical protein
MLSSRNEVWEEDQKDSHFPERWNPTDLLASTLITNCNEHDNSIMKCVTYE